MDGSTTDDSVALKSTVDVLMEVIPDLVEKVQATIFNRLKHTMATLSKSPMFWKVFVELFEFTDVQRISLVRWRLTRYGTTKEDMRVFISTIIGEDRVVEVAFRILDERTKALGMCDDEYDDKPLLLYLVPTDQRNALISTAFDRVDLQNSVDKKWLFCLLTAKDDDGDFAPSLTDEQAKFVFECFQDKSSRLELMKINIVPPSDLFFDVATEAILDACKGGYNYYWGGERDAKNSEKSYELLDAFTAHHPDLRLSASQTKTMVINTIAHCWNPTSTLEGWRKILQLCDWSDDAATSDLIGTLFSRSKDAGSASVLSVLLEILGNRMERVVALVKKEQRSASLLLPLLRCATTVHDRPVEPIPPPSCVSKYWRFVNPGPTEVKEGVELVCSWPRDDHTALQDIVCNLQGDTKDDMLRTLDLLYSKKLLEQRKWNMAQVLRPGVAIPLPEPKFLINEPAPNLPRSLLPSCSEPTPGSSLPKDLYLSFYNRVGNLNMGTLIEVTKSSDSWLDENRLPTTSMLDILKYLNVGTSGIHVSPRSGRLANYTLTLAPHTETEKWCIISKEGFDQTRDVRGGGSSYTIHPYQRQKRFKVSDDVVDKSIKELSGVVFKDDKEAVYMPRSYDDWEGDGFIMQDLPSIMDQEYLPTSTFGRILLVAGVVFKRPLKTRYEGFEILNRGMGLLTRADVLCKDFTWRGDDVSDLRIEWETPKPFMDVHIKGGGGFRLR
jgi:hypothetical protein